MNYHIDQLYQVAGLIGCMVILIYCLVQVFSPKIREGVLGCILYLTASTACVAWLIHMQQGTYPHRTTIVLMVSIASLMARRLVLMTSHWRRFRSWYFLQVKHAKSHNAARRK